MVVVSHDRELLDLVDQIADLRDGEVSWYGGNFSAYEEALAVEQEAAERMVRVAEADVKRQKRELADAQVKLARRKRYGQKMYDQKREPKIVMGARKRAAQESAGKHRIMHEERLAEAKERLDEAVEAVRDDDEIRVDLPYTAVPPGRTVLTLRDLELAYGGDACGSFDVRGPERIALIGRNGAGKTTLLRTIAGELDAGVRRGAGPCAAAVPAAAARRARRRADRRARTWPGSRPAPPTTGSGRGSPASCSGAPAPTSGRRPCPAANASGRRSPR